MKNTMALFGLMTVMLLTTAFTSCSYNMIASLADDFDREFTGSRTLTDMLPRTFLLIGKVEKKNFQISSFVCGSRGCNVYSEFFSI